MSQASKTLLILSAFAAMSAILLIGLGSALFPLLISLGLAYLSYPLVRTIERRGIQRHYALVSVFALMILVAGIVLAVVVPGLVDDGQQFLQEFPQTSARAAAKVEAIASYFGFTFNMSSESLKELLIEQASKISGDFLKSSSNFLKQFFSSVAGGVLFILNLLLIPLFFFHLINRYEVISEEAKLFVPIPWRPKAREYVQLANSVLSGYLRGQMLVALILATLYGLGFSVVGLRFGLLIGIGTGLLSVIPFVGPIVGFVVAIAVTLANFSGFGTIGGVVVVFMIVQMLEGLVITPKLVGDKVGLSVLSTMLALIIGGNLFGFVGMIIAIPTTSILSAVLRDLKQEYLSLSFYKGSTSSGDLDGKGE